MQASLFFDCPHCKYKNEVIIEIDSPSDYYYDGDCENCNKNMNINGELDKQVYDEAVDCVVMAADYACDR